MIEADPDVNQETRKVHIDNLYRVVQYCENKIDCRRAQQIQYFGERNFDSSQCKLNTSTTCDNCSNNTQVCFLILNNKNCHFFKYVLKCYVNRVSFNIFLNILCFKLC